MISDDQLKYLATVNWAVVFLASMTMSDINQLLFVFYAAGTVILLGIVVTVYLGTQSPHQRKGRK